MNFFSLISKVRRFVSVTLVAIALLINFASASFAAPLTPDVAAQEIQQSDSPEEAGKRLQQKANDYKQELKEDSNYTKKAVEDVAEGSKNKLEQAVDTVVEKLNLNEPLPESTKEFLDQTEGQVTKTVAPVVEGRPGFFKFQRNK
ncbi:MAG TPA: hypothetical protein V6D18_17255 [Thermosynechococcaceae cyanobacterium]